MLFPFFGHSMRLISQKFRHLQNWLFFAQAGRELRYVVVFWSTKYYLKQPVIRRCEVLRFQMILKLWFHFRWYPPICWKLTISSVDIGVLRMLVRKSWYHMRGERFDVIEYYEAEVDRLVEELCRQTLSPALQTMGGVRSRRGQPSWEFSEPDRKKTLPLHSWRPLEYKSHIECTSPSRSKIRYICALPLSK